MTSAVLVSGKRLTACSSAMLLLALVGCGWATGSPRPPWIDGESSQFPPAQYLCGVGQADSRSLAAEQAYAAVARIFKAEITAQAKDWESYLVAESGGRARTKHRLTLDHVTRVTTDKVLDNVRILDSWFDHKSRQYYALAGMNRAQAEAAMVERLTELDRAIHADVMDAQQTTDKLSYVRRLKRAGKNLVLREAYNTDLRIIRPSGQGHAAAYRLTELTNQLEQFLTANLGISVEMSGEQADSVQRALVDGLTREGFTVVDRRAAFDAAPADLSIRGTVRLWPLEVPDPRFQYVRWCTDAVMEEMSTHRVIGAVSKGGREGHVSEREAVAKAVRVMQQEFASDVARSIAAHLYGEIDLPISNSASSGCPGQTARPQRNQ